ncbi:zinc-ribbon domain-containing protein [Chloroflexota bacterium]
MSFDDKTIQCIDCSTSFTFSAGEQEFFASKGFTNEPKRCPECRRANKAKRSDSGFNNGGYQNSYASHY